MIEHVYRHVRVSLRQKRKRSTLHRVYSHCNSLPSNPPAPRILAQCMFQADRARHSKPCPPCGIWLLLSGALPVNWRWLSGLRFNELKYVKPYASDYEPLPYLHTIQVSLSKDMTRIKQASLY